MADRAHSLSSRPNRRGGRSQGASAPTAAHSTPGASATAEHDTEANSIEANFQVDLSGTAPSVQPSESAGATSADASGTHLLPPTLHAAAPISEISVTAALPEQSPPVDDDATPGLVDSDDESETLLPSFSSQQTQSCPDHPDSAEPSAGPRYTQFSDASSSTPAPSAPPSARGGTTMANINSLSNNLAGFDLERILTQVTSTLATSITTSITQSLTVALQSQSTSLAQSISGALQSQTQAISQLSSVLHVNQTVITNALAQNSQSITSALAQSTASNRSIFVELSDKLQSQQHELAHSLLRSMETQAEKQEQHMQFIQQQLAGITSPPASIRSISRASTLNDFAKNIPSDDVHDLEASAFSQPAFSFNHAPARATNEYEREHPIPSRANQKQGDPKQDVTAPPPLKKAPVVPTPQYAKVAAANLSHSTDSHPSFEMKRDPRFSPFGQGGDLFYKAAQLLIAKDTPPCLPKTIYTFLNKELEPALTFAFEFYTPREEPPLIHNFVAYLKKQGFDTKIHKFNFHNSTVSNQFLHKMRIECITFVHECDIMQAEEESKYSEAARAARVARELVEEEEFLNSPILHNLTPPTKRKSSSLPPPDATAAPPSRREYLRNYGVPEESIDQVVDYIAMTQDHTSGSRRDHISGSNSFTATMDSAHPSNAPLSAPPPFVPVPENLMSAQTHAFPFQSAAQPLAFSNPAYPPQSAPPPSAPPQSSLPSNHACTPSCASTRLPRVPSSSVCAHGRSPHRAKPTISVPINIFQHVYNLRLRPSVITTSARDLGYAQNSDSRSHLGRWDSPVFCAKGTMACTSYTDPHSGCNSSRLIHFLHSSQPHSNFSFRGFDWHTLLIRISTFSLSPSHSWYARSVRQNQHGGLRSHRRTTGTPRHHASPRFFSGNELQLCVQSHHGIYNQIRIYANRLRFASGRMEQFKTTPKPICKRFC